MYYCYRCLRGEFSQGVLDTQLVAEKFNGMLASPGTMAFWTIAAILLSFGICAFGVQKGVERVSKFMMVALLALIVLLAVNSVRLPGALEGVKFYLIPDFEKIKEVGIGNVVFGAMSQSFFTLSLGIGAMAIFGSYLDKDRSLSGEARSIGILDTFVALMAGMIIIPACFAFGVEQDSGPSLIFITLPQIFNQMPGGRVWGALFFLFLSFAALTTVVAVFENILSFAMDLFGVSRKKAVAVNIVLVILLSMPAVLGFNVLSYTRSRVSRQYRHGSGGFSGVQQPASSGIPGISDVLYAEARLGMGQFPFGSEFRKGNEIPHLCPGLYHLRNSPSCGGDLSERLLGYVRAESQGRGKSHAFDRLDGGGGAVSDPDFLDHTERKKESGEEGTWIRERMRITG